MPPSIVQRGILSGIRVLDLSSYVAGPYACSLLADMGAEVIKVEPPNGDQLRHYPSTLNAESRAFLGLNRSKLGIALDLKKVEGVEALLRLAATTDVLVHNFRPSVPPRLGIGYSHVRAINPRIIYCALTGYGDCGPMKDKAGYDQVLQAFTGICVFQGAQRGNPEIVAGSIVDYYAASLLASSVCAALYHRERTGQGQSISLSLLGAALAMQSARFVWVENEPRDVERDLRSGGVTGIYATAAGDLYLSANTERFWRALCEILRLPELARDPDYDTIRKRAARADEIAPKIREALASRTALEWERLFGDRVPCCALRAIGEMFEHPQTLAEELVAFVKHPRVGNYRALRNPVKFSASPGPPPFAAPMLGQHSDEILAGAGYDEREIAELRALGVISPAGRASSAQSE